MLKIKIWLSFEFLSKRGVRSKADSSLLLVCVKIILLKEFGGKFPPCGSLAFLCLSCNPLKLSGHFGFKIRYPDKNMFRGNISNLKAFKTIKASNLAVG